MIGPKMDLTANTIATSGDTLILPAPLFYWRTPTQLERQFSRINDQDTWKQDLSVEYNFIFTICKTSSFSPHRRICAMRLEQATLNWWPIHTACSYLSFSIAKLPWRGGRLIRVASEKGLQTLMEIWPHLPFCGIRSRTIWNISYTKLLNVGSTWPSVEPKEKIYLTKWRKRIIYFYLLIE